MGRFQTVLAARERRRARRYDVQVKALITDSTSSESAQVNWSGCGPVR